MTMMMISAMLVVQVVLVQVGRIDVGRRWAFCVVAGCWGFFIIGTSCQ
jgi:hypothetical protein